MRPHLTITLLAAATTITFFSALLAAAMIGGIR